MFRLVFKVVLVLVAVGAAAQMLYASDTVETAIEQAADQDGLTNEEGAPPIETEHVGNIKVGDIAPDFTLPNVDGAPRNLYKLLEQGPIVLSFYRGGWCPYCNDQLYAYQQILPEFQELGAELVAVSPEKPESANDTAIKNELVFEVLSDEGNQVARAYDLLWEVPEEKREQFSEWLKGETGKTLTEFNGVNNYELPIPATFVIAPDHTVVYVFQDEDYKKRAKMDDILDALENLNKHMPDAE